MWPWVVDDGPPHHEACGGACMSMEECTPECDAHQIYGCGNVPQTIAESSDTSPIHCAQHVLQSVNMSIQLPAGLQCDPFQMAEVVQQEYVLIWGARLYPRVNVANTVHFSKHHSYCLQSQIRGCKGRPPESPLIADDLTNDSLTLHPLSVHILPYIRKYSVPWNNPHTLILGEDILKNNKNGFN